MSALRIVAYFLVFGSSWILVSDRMLDFLVADHGSRAFLQSVKGIAFVVLSATLIYVLARSAERKQAFLRSEALAEKDRLAKILNINPAVIYALRPEGKNGFSIDFVGHNVERITGYPVATWLAHRDFWHGHVHPDDLAKVDKAQYQLFTTDRVRHEYRFLHADGQYRWIDDNIILLRDSRGKPSQILGSWLDITDRKAAEVGTVESESRYRQLFDANPLPMWVYDLQTLSFLSVNEAALVKYGYSREEFLSMTLLDIRPAEEREHLQAFLTPERRQAHQSAGAGSEPQVWRHRKKDGTVFWVEISGHTLDFEGRPGRLVLAQDITDRRQAEERLRLIGEVFQSSQEGIFITDAKGLFISINDSFTHITGYAMAELQGHTPSVLSSGRHDKAFYKSMWAQIDKEGRWEGEIWNRKKTGEVYPEWLTISAIADDAGGVQQYLGIFTETSSRKAAEERIHRLANYDNLTNLPNRALLHDRAKVAFAAAIRNHAGVVIMHVNVDHFRSINESFGHEAGDLVLIEIARRLTTSLRPEDTVSRTGGDDFVILLPNTNGREAAQVALHLMAHVARPFELAGQDVRLTASIGIAEFPENGSDLVQLTQAAESAVHQAKRGGPNSVNFFSPSVQEQVKESLAVERDLRYAVERDQLVLHYQPQIDIASQRIIGAEALVRWQHPLWGLVAPSRFIPIAESAGLIREIGQWVMQEALNQTARWRANGLPIVPIAINLSLAQFKHAGLRDAIIEALRESGVPAHMLELELTESVAMEDSNFTIATIDGLKRLGVMLSIDDFGTGYSSLSYLKRFDVDKLKIDQSFIRGLNYDPEDEAIVSTVINLARSLGLRTIAEGVETAEQLEFLRQRGCDEFQGYFFSRPVPADDFAALLQKSATLPPGSTALSSPH